MAHGLVRHLAEAGAEVIVAELGDGILGDYGVAPILADRELMALAAAIVMCANDPVAAWGAKQVMAQRFGLAIDVVSGPTTDNLVGTRFVEAELGLTAINARTHGPALGDFVADRLNGRGGPPVNKPIHAAILGGSGYGAGELLRLLVQHPAVAVVSVTEQVARRLAGRRAPSAPSRLLRPDGHRKSRPPAVPGRRTRRAVFGAAARRQRRDAGWAFGGATRRTTRSQGDRPVGRPAAERCRGAQKAYPGSPWLPERRRQFVYGLPELNRERIQARPAASPIRAAWRRRRSWPPRR